MIRRIVIERARPEVDVRYDRVYGCRLPDDI
jgi:hypothetical protein